MVFYKYNRSRRTTVISHVNSNESNNLNTSDSYNVIGTSNITHSNVQNDTPLNKLITLQKLTDIYSSVITNNEITD